MLVLGLDLETTGLDLEKDKITEVGAILWDTDENMPVRLMNELIKWPEGTYGFPLSAEIQRVTGLTDEILNRFGKTPDEVLLKLEEMSLAASYIIAHNGNGFDKPMLVRHLTGLPIENPHLTCLPWIDTRTDLPHKEIPDSHRLSHLAMDMGFINPFPHRAVSDVLTMLKVMSQFDFDEVLRYSDVPNIIVRALVGYDDREKAKAQRYSWEKVGDKTFPKMWVKQIKQDKFEEEKKRCDFSLAILDRP